MPNPSTETSEPSKETMEEMGRLCGAWSFLESVSETTVWGITGADEKLGPLITWRLDLNNRWNMILEHAPKKHDEAGLKRLREFQKTITKLTRDRNIIIHGLIHAAGTQVGSPRPDGSIDQANITFTRIPCWTVYRGAEAGKNFPVSTKAVQIVRENIQKVGHKVRTFNIEHGYTKQMISNSPVSIEADWPKPLE